MGGGASVFSETVTTLERHYNAVPSNAKTIIMWLACGPLFLCSFLYARLKNGTYYVTGYGVGPFVNFFVSG